MATDKEQETLDRILAELKSGDSERCVQALNELSTLHFSSPAILNEIERLAIHHPEEEVQEHANRSLRSSVHQFVRRNVNQLDEEERAFLLNQIDRWAAEGVLPSTTADVLRARVGFDKVTAHAAPESASPIQNASPSIPASPDLPPRPRASLTQTLLNEASIRVYLYLGAFFVISAALILAAVVEAARLPILAAATLLFGGGALALRKRLPQPSFALFVVFSFLLPIDANVLEETIGLTEPALSIYWTIVFLAMAAIWGFSVWFYDSSFFSAVAFIALSLAFYRAGEIFDAEIEGIVFFGVLASFAGLAAAYALRRWKGRKFSLFVFLLAQLQVLALLLVSFTFALVDVFNSDLGTYLWLLVALTWLSAAVFFALSDALVPFVLFPWLAVAALLPLPWFLLNAIQTTQSAHAVAFFLWGIFLALAGDATLQLRNEKAGRYHWALLTSSALLFVTAVSIALEEDRPGLTFTLLLSTAVVYGILHLLRPRVYVWGAALLGALFAFFTFFTLPAVERLGIPFLYQILTASLLLLTPELFTKTPFSGRSKTRLPAIALGVLVSLLGTAVALSDLDQPGGGALVLLVYAILFALHALHSQRAEIGYAATVSLALAVIKLCDALNIENWTLPLIGLAILYYLGGSWLRRSQKVSDWGQVLLYSGLGLGALTSLGAPLQGGLDAFFAVAITATLFAVEAFARRNVWWALPANLFYLLSYFMLLLELDVDEPQVYSIGAALLGMVVHYLLTRAGSRTGAFLAGMLSQFVLLGTTYIQMVSTERLLFFFVLFVQSMVVLIYGLIVRSRSLVITPIGFVVLGVVTVVYSALKGLGPVILIGSTGLLLLMAGIVAVLMRERITRLGEQLSDWKP